MYRRPALLLPLLLGLLALPTLLVGCARSEAGEPALAEPLALPARTALLARIAEMGEAVDEMARLAEAGADGPALREAFRAARAAYKAAEPHVAYHAPSAADLLNMAALPHVGEFDPSEIVRPPQGFQVVEELLFPAYDPAAKGELLLELRYLRAAVRRAERQMEVLRMTDRNVFEAARLSLVRLQSLGLSGFDSPVALASLEEGALTLEALRANLAPYAADARRAAPEAWARLDERLAGAAAHLRSPHHTFETFDRLHFTRGWANPITASLRDVRAALGVDANPAVTAVRPEAASIWDRDAFDASFFAAAGSGEATPERVELGRLLFFDPVLSGNGQRACASCHQPERAFTDGRAKSLGFDFEEAPLRNAPTILGAALQGASAYDLTTVSVEQRAEGVITNPHEMHAVPAEVAALLRKSPEYAERFRAAFGELTETELARRIPVALADYVRSLSRLDSPFDRYARGETDTLDASARRGFNLFMGKALCGTCHFAPLFNGTVPPDFGEHEAEVLGVPARPDTASAVVDSDLGRHAVFGYELHKHAFKTTTVRNVAVTAPYMHNGVYATLEEVVDFYDRGGGAGIGIELENQTLPPDPLGLTDAEIGDLVTFMEALTDTAGTTGRPAALPSFPGRPDLDARPVGGVY